MNKPPKINFETAVSAITDYICFQMALQTELKPSEVQMVTTFHMNLLEDLLDELQLSYIFENQDYDLNEDSEIVLKYLEYSESLVEFLKGKTDELSTHPHKHSKQAQKPLEPSLVKSDNIEKLQEEYKNKHASEYLKDIIHEKFQNDNIQESIESFLESFTEPNEYKAIIEYKMLPTSSQALELATMLNFDVNDLIELYKRHYWQMRLTVL